MSKAAAPAPIPSLEDDPCGRAKALRAIRDAIITSGSVTELDKEHGNGVRRRLRWSTADLGRLDREIAAAENRCLLKSGKRGRRFAVTPGGRGW